MPTSWSWPTATSAHLRFGRSDMPGWRLLVRRRRPTGIWRPLARRRRARAAGSTASGWRRRSGLARSSPRRCSPSAIARRCGSRRIVPGDGSAMSATRSSAISAICAAAIARAGGARCAGRAARAGRQRAGPGAIRVAALDVDDVQRRRLARRPYRGVQGRADRDPRRRCPGRDRRPRNRPCPPPPCHRGAGPRARHRRADPAVRRRRRRQCRADRRVELTPAPTRREADADAIATLAAPKIDPRPTAALFAKLSKARRATAAGSTPVSSTATGQPRPRAQFRRSYVKGKAYRPRCRAMKPMR